jgi:hypothetical protein
MSLSMFVNVLGGSTSGLSIAWATNLSVPLT